MPEQAAAVMADSHASGLLNIYTAVLGTGSVDATGRLPRHPGWVSTAHKREKYKNELDLI